MAETRGVGAWVKWAVGTAAVAVLAVGFIGFLHTTAARPLLPE